jgi:hypothetical protein
MEPFFGYDDEAESTRSEALARFMAMLPVANLDDVCNASAMGCLAVCHPEAIPHILWLMPPTPAYDARRCELGKYPDRAAALGDYVADVAARVAASTAPIPFPLPDIPPEFTARLALHGRLCESDKADTAMACTLYRAHTPHLHALVHLGTPYRAFLDCTAGDEPLRERVIHPAMRTVASVASDSDDLPVRYVAQLHIAVEVAASKTLGRWTPRVRTIHDVVYVAPADFYISPDHGLYVCDPARTLVGPFPDALSCIASWHLLDPTPSHQVVFAHL